MNKLGKIDKNSQCEENNMKIAVAGTGYVGLSISVLLAQHNDVYAVDIIPKKVAMINNKKSPIVDKEIEEYLAEKELSLTATLDAKEAYTDAEFVVIATPTNYDEKKNYFDTSSVEQVIETVMDINPDAIMVIKSTVPVGYTKNVRAKFNCHGKVSGCVLYVRNGAWIRLLLFLLRSHQSQNEVLCIRLHLRRYLLRQSVKLRHLQRLYCFCLTLPCCLLIIRPTR